MTLETPKWLWGATGMRAVDHAVESIWASPRSSTGFDARAPSASRPRGPVCRLREIRASSELRLRCQHAAWFSVFGLFNVGLRLTHPIGHPARSPLRHPARHHVVCRAGGSHALAGASHRRRSGRRGPGRSESSGATTNARPRRQRRRSKLWSRSWAFRSDSPTQRRNAKSFPSWRTGSTPKCGSSRRPISIGSHAQNYSVYSRESGSRRAGVARSKRVPPTRSGDLVRFRQWRRHTPKRSGPFP